MTNADGTPQELRRLRSGRVGTCRRCRGDGRADHGRRWYRAGIPGHISPANM
jgi:hypothetical protein